MKKQSKKKIITETVWEASPYEFEGTATDLRTRIDEWIEIYGPNFRIDWNPHRHYDYDSNPSPCFNILRDREETPEEETRRLEQEAAQQSARLEHERKEFERLKQKFGE